MKRFSPLTAIPLHTARPHRVVRFPFSYSDPSVTSHFHDVFCFATFQPHWFQQNQMKLSVDDVISPLPLIT